MYETAPAADFVPVTPSDEEDLPRTARALWIETGGTLRFITSRGRDVTLTVPAGYFSAYVKKVFSSDTTAAGIYAVE